MKDEMRGSKLSYLGFQPSKGKIDFLKIGGVQTVKVRGLFHETIIQLSITPIGLGPT